MRNKKKWFCFLCLVILLALLPVTAQAASAKYTLSGVKKPSTIVKGASFIIGGTVSCNKKIKEVRVTIYNSTKKVCLQKYTAKPNAKTFNIAQADPYMVFGKLAIGQYYYNVRCKVAGSAKVVISKKFSVVGTGQIKIVNPKPSADTTITSGSALIIGGKITSTYRLAGVTAAIINESGQNVYKKTVKPNTVSYTVGSELDNAMLFDQLAAGTYKYKLTAVDSQGKSATLIYRTITVNGGSSVTPGSTGGTVSNPSDYLTTTSPVTTPAGFQARTTRPASNIKYYYDENYNIYYKYDSLAPTGEIYYGSGENAYYVTGNCTWYACGRAMEIVAAAGGDINKVKAIFGGDPVGIYHANVTKGVFEYGTTPRIGALAIFNYGSGGDAHIAVVENVVGGIPYVSESGYTVSKTRPNDAKSNIVFQYQSIYNWAGGRNLLGYIYLL